MSACKIHPFYTKQFSINSCITGELNKNAFVYQAAGCLNEHPYHPVRQSMAIILKIEGDSPDMPNPINLN